MAKTDHSCDVPREMSGPSTFPRDYRGFFFPVVRLASAGDAVRTVNGDLDDLSGITGIPSHGGRPYEPRKVPISARMEQERKGAEVAEGMIIRELLGMRREACRRCGSGAPQE